MESDRQRGKVLVASTGKDSELLETVSITRARGEAKRVAMSLGQHRRPFSRLPDLQPGDRLRVSAELQVTTDCARPGPGCVDGPYEYAPLVRARLLLARDPSVTEVERDLALRLSEAKEERVSQREHHHVFVFTDAGIRIPDRGLPWGSDPSFVNLVLDAHNRSATPGHVLLVGENEPDGSVKGDKGRLNAVRLRGEIPDPRSEEAAEPERSEIPVDRELRSVVYSLPLAGLARDEQLAIRAKLIVSASHLPYPARISTRLILADERSQVDTGGRAAEISTFRGEIAENNGTNCLPRAERCTTRKVGVLRINRDADRALFVNLVAVSADPLGGGRRGDAIRVEPGGGVEAVRYSPRLKG
jgi:hypothetical protein